MTGVVTGFCLRCGRNYVLGRDGSRWCWCGDDTVPATETSAAAALATTQVLATTLVQVTFEIRHAPSVDSEDLGRRISEVAHAATNGLAFDEEQLLHDVKMFGVAIVGHRVTRRSSR
jgi:BarA-like signal transduction histidine kinase